MRTKQRWNDYDIHKLKQQVRRQLDGGAWVYFVVCNEAWVKIGSARSVSTRMEALQTACPYSLRVAYVELDESTSGVASERRYHRRFASLRGRGEWFEYRDSLKEFLDSKRPENLV